jgi:hypothetical protein
MDKQFDELSKSLAEGVSRREAILALLSGAAKTEEAVSVF